MLRDIWLVIQAHPVFHSPVVLPDELRRSEVTLKYQVTLPKAIADHSQIRPGDDIDWVPAGDIIRVIPPDKAPPGDDRELRLRLFDQATERIRQRKIQVNITAVQLTTQ